MPTTYTPLRYPGGKSSTYPFVKSIICQFDLGRSTYTEPFAGGAGLAIKLLLCKDVERIHLNDLDPAISNFWSVVVQCSEGLCRRVESAEVSMVEWERQREIFAMGSEVGEEEFAFATLYLNRTNVSGILKGGVIGGRQQQGTSKIGARFNRATLVRKIRAISQVADRIQVTQYDASEMLRNGWFDQDSFLNIDPPYVKRGPALYRNFFSESDHVRLSSAITALSSPWILTYDDTAMVRRLYESVAAGEISIPYSIGRVRRATELVFFSQHLSSSLTDRGGSVCL